MLDTRTIKANFIGNPDSIMELISQKNFIPNFFKSVKDYKRSESYHNSIFTPVILVDIPFSSWVKEIRKEYDVLIPVICISNTEDIDEVRESLNTGVFDFLVGPVNRVELQAKIERASNFIKQQKKTYVHRNLEKFLNLTKIENLYLKTFSHFNFQPTKAEIIENVWGGKLIHAKNFDVHLHNFRKKLQRFHITVERQKDGHYVLTYNDLVVFESFEEAKLMRSENIERKKNSNLEYYY